MRLIKLITLLVFLTITVKEANSQTILRDIPIIVDENTPMKIEILVYYEGDPVGDSVWVDIFDIGLEHSYGWYATERINIKVPKGGEYKFRFISVTDKEGECYLYTYLTVKGEEEKTIIRSTEESPIEFALIGGNHRFPIPKGNLDNGEN